MAAPGRATLHREGRGYRADRPPRDIGRHYSSAAICCQGIFPALAVPNGDLTVATIAGILWAIRGDGGPLRSPRSRGTQMHLAEVHLRPGRDLFPAAGSLCGTQTRAGWTRRRAGTLSHRQLTTGAGSSVRVLAREQNEAAVRQVRSPKGSTSAANAWKPSGRARQPGREKETGGKPEKQ